MAIGSLPAAEPQMTSSWMMPDTGTPANHEKLYGSVTFSPDECTTLESLSAARPAMFSVT